jgi:hypothetical protein
MHNFCTSFDTGKFLAHGLALYRSLERFGGDFTLWNICFDDAAFDSLSKLDMPRMRVMRISELEAADPEFRAVKSERRLREYAMTSKACALSYLLAKHSLPSICWIDADIYLFSSLEPVYRSFEDCSAMVSPHRFVGNDPTQEALTGTYNAGFVFFRNDEDGRAALSWWRARGIEWCDSYFDNGRFGEQMYLNHLPRLFKRVRVLEHPGTNVAYWNIGRHRIWTAGGTVFVRDTRTGAEGELVFYHYSGLDLFRVGSEVRFIYKRRHIDPRLYRLVYKPYLREIAARSRIVIKKGGGSLFEGIPSLSLMRYRVRIIEKSLLSYVHLVTDKYR